MRALRLFSCVAVTGAALLASVTTATASPLLGMPREVAAPSALTLSVTHDGITSDAPKVAELLCNPAGGTHPKAAEACKQIQLAQGDFSKLNAPGRGAACTMEYDPFEVTATGTWRGKLVTHKATYANPCVLASATGTVFRF